MTPATDLARVTLAGPGGARLGVHGRHALLALAVLADADLSSPRGLDAVRPERVAELVGLARSTVDRTLRGLAVDGLAIVVVDYAATRHHYTGPAAARLPRGARVAGYRPSHEAYQ